MGPIVRPRRSRIYVLVALALLGLALPGWSREQKVLQKRSSPPADPQTRARDAWLDQTSPTANHGGDTTLRVQSFNPGTGQNQRALVEFDVSSIPRSGIKLARLTMFMSAAPSASRTYQARRVTSLWTEADATWNSRLPGPTAWSTAGGGGDFGGVTASVATGTTGGVFLNWTITADVLRYFSGQPPLPNYGTLIRDARENSATARSAIFASKEDPTEANRPGLTVEFVQNIVDLIATPGDGDITLSWSYPAPLGTVLPGTATVGVLILRKAGSPILQTAVPADGTAPALCSLIGDGTVVFLSSLTAPNLETSFVDSAACGGLTNGTTYYYKVFTRDGASGYSASGASSSFVPEAMATPNTPGLEQAALWMAPTGTATLGPTGLSPGEVTVVGSNSRLLMGFNPSNGSDVFAPVSTGGVINGRPPVLDAIDTSLGRAVTYIPDRDNFVYAIDATTGETIWLANPTGLATNAFNAGTAVLVRSFSMPTYLLTHELVVVGTRNTASISTNRIVGIGGNTGATVWTVAGNAAATNATPGMDIVTTSPFVDYANNVIWATTNNNGAGAAASCVPGGLPTAPCEPDLWKIDANTGAVLAVANLGGNIGSSPSLSDPGEVLFVGTANGRIKAMSPTLVDPGPPITIHTLATNPSPGDGAVKGFPLVLGTASPYTIVFATNTQVHAISFDTSSNTFTPLWTNTTLGCNPSAAVGFTGLTNFSAQPVIYLGCSNGRLHQLRIADGVDEAQRIVNPTATVGEPSIDVLTLLVITGATDGRVYAFTFPF